HYLVDWHLTRTDPVGVGAGARFRVKAPLQRFNWVGLNIVEADVPRRIVEVGAGGKFNRVKVEVIYTVTAAAAAASAGAGADPGAGPGAGGEDAERTEVSLGTRTEPATTSDRLMEVFGGRPWVRRQQTKALKRLRSILETGEGRGSRPTVSGR
ncbi:MAG: hypothetical protein LC720_05620, partial [Actinobacteria bacterium]|nr:hypothetical protein [Actinomycetota bacterium]